MNPVGRVDEARRRKNEGDRDLVSLDSTGFPKIVCYKSDAYSTTHGGGCRSCRFREGKPDLFLHCLRCAPNGKLCLAHNIIGAGDVAVHDAYFEDCAAAHVRHFKRTVEHWVQRVCDNLSLKMDFSSIGRRISALDDDIRVACTDGINLGRGVSKWGRDKQAKSAITLGKFLQPTMVRVMRPMLSNRTKPLANQAASPLERECVAEEGIVDEGRWLSTRSTTTEGEHTSNAEFR